MSTKALARLPRAPASVFCLPGIISSTLIHGEDVCGRFVINDYFMRILFVVVPLPVFFSDKCAAHHGKRTVQLVTALHGCRLV